MEYGQTKADMIQEAAESNNMALRNAVRCSRNIDDLKRCVKQAHGLASERFRKLFAFVLNA